MPSFALHTLHSKPSDVQAWDEIVERSTLGDVYYRPGYVRAWESLENAAAVAVSLSRADEAWLVPLLQRSFVHPAHGHKIHDAVTPYGYGGILYASEGIPTPQAAGVILSELRNWCQERNLVCCVLRLHPLANQAPWFEPLLAGDPAGLILKRRGKTTAIDLRQWNPEAGLLRGASKGRLSDLAFARKRLHVTWSSSSEDVGDSYVSIFYQGYLETMKRIGAEPFYAFSLPHFATLRSQLRERSDIAIAWHGSEAVGAAFFLADRTWAHYHLSSTTEAGRKLKASTLLLHEGARWAWERGCRLLHLGGGRRENDTLMQFKSSFGGSIFDYHTLTVIANREKFLELCRDSRSPWPYSAF